MLPYALAFAASLVALTTTAGQAQTYPTKTIKIVVPYPAGGPTDLVGRTLADALTKALKKTVIVENKVGAGGTIGSDSVVKSAPDGYTLLLGLMGPMSIAPKISPESSIRSAEGPRPDPPGCHSCRRCLLPDRRLD